jgi:energy-coupling factor transporter ATP-binding protein EcfA2
MATTFPTFQRLRVAGWRQFASIDIEFHPRLTVLTGANGAGKSTLLNILATHLGASRPYLSVPQKDGEGIIRFSSGIFQLPRNFVTLVSSWLMPTTQPGLGQVGEIGYSNGITGRLRVPPQANVQYSAQVEQQQQVMGFHIGSHRMLPTYQTIPHIPFVGIEPDNAFGMLSGEAHARYAGGNTNSSMIFQIKNMIAAWAAMGEGNSVLAPNPRQLKAYEGLTELLRVVIPKELGFLSLAIRPPEVVVVTRSGEFLIDAASGGLTTLIEIASLIYVCSIRSDIDGSRFVVTIDEPENHLHPSLQRSLLPTLVEAFPQVQFVIATHSPFMVSSLRDSSVYVLRHSELDGATPSLPISSRRIVSERLDYQHRAGTASEVLRDVLGVPTTLPEWVEKELASVVEKYRSKQIDESTLAALKTDLKIAGLNDLFGEALLTLGRGK